MKYIKTTITAIILIALFCILGNYSIVKHPTGTNLIEKPNFSMDNIYLDISTWTAAQCWEKEHIREAILKGDIPDFNNLAAKLGAIKVAKSLGHKVDELLKDIEDGIKSFDEKYKITETVKNLPEKWNEFDKEHGITKRSKQVIDTSTQYIKRLWEDLSTLPEPQPTD